MQSTNKVTKEKSPAVDPMIEILEKMREDFPSETFINNMASFFKVFSDPTRVKILLSLEDKEMCVQHIAEFIDMSHSATSHQLRILRESNMVDSRREGKKIFYFLKDEHITQIMKQSTQHICENC